MRAWAAVLVLALLAGCAGKTETPVQEAVSALAGPSAEELARTPGTLQGIVHSPSLAPVPNATLTIPRENRSATTDEAGLFRFQALAAGEHMITITAAGFDTRSVTVAVRNGTLSEVDIAMTPAGPTDPYAQTRELAGFLSCAARAQTPAAEERYDCAAADPNHRDIFEFDVDADAKEVVVELVWDTAASPAGKDMTLFVETAGYGSLDLDLGNATGAGHVAIRVPASVMEKYYPEGGMLRARVELAPTTPVVAAVQSSFTVYVTTFYHGAAPADFSIVG
jgi:hypothetical protein